MAVPKLSRGFLQAQQQQEEKNVASLADENENKLNEDIQMLQQHKAKWSINENGSVTFYPTPNCKASKQQFETQPLSLDRILEKQGCSKAAAYSDPQHHIVQQNENVCSFLTAALTAWSEHYPFRLRCEHIWLLILQGVAVHVDQNAEKLRKKYVQHEGKQILEVEVSADPSAKEWQAAIQTFVAQIDKNTVKDTCQLFDCDFSSSTMIERIATKVTIMDICKNYFDYRAITKCGFPQITLDGTKDDWIKLKQKVTALLKEKVDGKFGAEWGQALLPLLDRFVDAFEGKIDCVFWNSMIKRGATGGSGGYPWYSGWFNILFPFLTKEKNKYCVPYDESASYVQQGLTKEGRGRDQNKFSKYPIGLASAPVKWIRFGKEIELKFLAGFMGFCQDSKTLEICPNVGWCVAFADATKQ